MIWLPVSCLRTLVVSVMYETVRPPSRWLPLPVDAHLADLGKFLQVVVITSDHVPPVAVTIVERIELTPLVDVRYLVRDGSVVTHAAPLRLRA